MLTIQDVYEAELDLRDYTDLDNEDRDIALIRFTYTFGTLNQTKQVYKYILDNIHLDKKLW